MLEMWTNGAYKATLHRVKNVSDQDRLSAPFFFDPAFDCIIQPMQGLQPMAGKEVSLLARACVRTWLEGDPCPFLPYFGRRIATAAKKRKTVSVCCCTCCG